MQKTLSAKSTCHHKNTSYFVNFTDNHTRSTLSNSLHIFLKILKIAKNPCDPDLFVIYYCLFSLKELISFIDSLDKCHTSVFNALIFSCEEKGSSVSQWYSV